MKWHADQPVIISGAGVAGLTSALALANKGIASQIFEGVEKLEEVGAGLQLAPNATRLLAQYGVLKQLEDVGVIPNFLELKDGASLKTHLKVEIKNVAERRWHSSYITIHRADLQNVLYQAALNNPLIKINLGQKVVTDNNVIDSHVEVETLDSHNKTSNYSTPVLVAADGAWSKLRQTPPLNDHAQFSGFIAWRATIAVEDLPKSYQNTLDDIKTVAAWMGPKSHLVAYPIKAGKAINFVAITLGDNPGATWSKKGDKNQLKQLFSGWNPVILEIIDLVDDWTFWPLFQMPTYRFKGFNNKAFVGDCAHAFLPFLAQGAAMAIEDAAVLVETLSIDSLSIAEALSFYQSLRMPRVTTVSKRGNFNRYVYHLSGPVAMARNLMMKMRSAESFMASLDWLYGFDASQIDKKP